MENRTKGDRWFFSYFPGNTAGGLSSPLAPLFITEILGGGVLDYSLFTIFSSIASILGLFLWGYLSDKLKKRKIFVVMGFASLSITSLLLSFSFSVFYFITISFLAGLFGSATSPVVTVLIMELTDRKDWAYKISKFSQYSSYGQIVGVIFAAIFTDYIYNFTTLRYLYIAAFIFYVIAAVMSYILVPEPKAKVKREEVEIRTFRVIEKMRYFPSSIIHFNLHFKNLDRDLKRIIVGFFIMMTGFQIFFVAFPILLKDLDVNNTVFFLIYLGNYIFAAITFNFSGGLSSKFGNKRITFISVLARIFIFPSVILIVSLVHPRPLLFILLLLIYSILGSLWSFISVGTATLVSNLSKPEERGRVSGTYNAVQSFGVVIGSIATGFIVSNLGYDINFLVASAVTAVGLLIFMRIKG